MGTARDICYRALRRLGVMDAVAAAPDASDYAMVLDNLGVLIDSLPTEGSLWPHLSAVNVAVAWSGGTPNKVSAPATYLTAVMLYRADDAGKPVPLRPLTVQEWSDVADKTATGDPDKFFDAPDGSWYLHPVPTSDPGITATFCARHGAVSDMSNVEFGPEWELALEYGLTYHSADAFHSDPKRWFSEWERLRTRAINNTVQSAPISYTVED